jgi:hypothetical protein
MWKSLVMLCFIGLCDIHIMPVFNVENESNAAVLLAYFQIKLKHEFGK